MRESHAKCVRLGRSGFEGQLCGERRHVRERWLHLVHSTTILGEPGSPKRDVL